jgi:hypothetical protein
MDCRTTAVYVSDLAIDIHQQEISSSIGQISSFLGKSSIVVVYSGLELFINSNLQALSLLTSVDQIYDALVAFGAEERRRWTDNCTKIHRIYGVGIELSQTCLDFEGIANKMRDFLSQLADYDFDSLQRFKYGNIPVGEYSIQDYSYIYKNIHPSSFSELSGYRLLIAACCNAIDNILAKDLGRIKNVIYFNDYCWHMAIRSVAENNYKATVVCISNSVSTANRAESIQIRPRHLIELQLLTQRSWRFGLGLLALQSKEVYKIVSRIDCKLNGTHFTSFTPSIIESRIAMKSIEKRIGEYRNTYLFLTSSPDEASGIYLLYKAYIQANPNRNEAIPAFDSSRLQQDLIAEYISIARNNPNDLFIIRVHPRDGANGRYNIKSNAVMGIISGFSVEFSVDNLLVLDSDSNINTYLLATLCRATFTGWSSTCVELNILGLTSFALVSAQIPLLNTPPEFIIKSMKDYIDSCSRAPLIASKTGHLDVSDSKVRSAIIAYRWHACYNFMYENLSAATISESLQRTSLVSRNSWALPILEAYYMSHAEASDENEYTIIYGATKRYCELLKQLSKFKDHLHAHDSPQFSSSVDI